MLVSVIIPCYNNSQTIRRALESVLNQSISNMEIIIVDDASDDVDKTLWVIKELNDNRIKIIRHKTNLNGAAARNTGINESRGQYIAFLDADDEWLPGHLENSINYLKREHKDICYCQSIVKTTGFKDLILPKKEIRPNEKISNYLFCNGGYIPTPSLVFRKNSLNPSFNSKLIRHQDYDFLLRAEAQGLQIGMSHHIGVVVHWENNNPEAKGGTWQYSLRWAQNYKKYMTDKAYAYFIYKNTVIPLLKNKQRIKALQLFISQLCFLYLTPKQWLFFFSWFFTGKIIFNRIKK